MRLRGPRPRVRAMALGRVSVSTSASGTESPQRIALHRACSDLVRQVRLVGESTNQGRGRRRSLLPVREIVDDELDKTERLTAGQCPRVLGQIVSSAAHDEKTGATCSRG